MLMIIIKKITIITDSTINDNGNSGINNSNSHSNNKYNNHSDVYYTVPLP